jgi:CRISPR-associated protein Cas1
MATRLYPDEPPKAEDMHKVRDGSSAFIFDLMEPYRPLVDRNVLKFVKGHVFDPADFVIRSDGVCRLNPEMARSVVGICGLGSDVLI